MDKEIVLKQIDALRAASKQSPFKSAKNRIEVLKALKANIIEMEEEIAAALKKDLNKSKDEAYMCEIGLALSELSYMIRHCKHFAKEKRVYTPLAQFPARSFKKPCPHGVVLIISPWNYPFLLSIEPLIDAIASGNHVVLKSSSSSPNVSEVIKKLILKTFSPQHVLYVKGGREECNFLLDLDFDHIFFTGGARVGKTIMQKCAEKFIPVTLELGGKSPCIVDETAKIELAARRIVFGKFMNAGQTCVAPDYVLCHSSIKDQLVREIEKQIIVQYGVDALRNENYPKIINQRQFDAHINLLKESEVIFGGKTNESLLKIEPTLVNATFESECMKEEIFGPILPILTFENLDEVIGKFDGLSKPLALYVFSSSKENQKKIISSCEFGGGCINDTIIHLATSHLGFGGIKQSGIGSYHGKAGFDTFSHYKSIVNKKTWLDLPMRYQPIGKFKRFLIRLFLK